MLKSRREIACRRGVLEFGFYLPNSGEGAMPDALASIAGLGDRLGFLLHGCARPHPDAPPG